jgi:enoyl-CoA hydratase/carnithine racemase
MTEATRVSTDVEKHVFKMGLNRPDKMNAFDLQMLKELSEAFAAYEANPELRCALLYAKGDNFTAGLDLAEVGPAVADGKPLFPELGIDPLDLSDPRRTKPTVCAVQGYCLTIGVELLLASDIRLAAQGTKFAQMEVCRGIMPFGGATLRFPQIAGWGNAMRYLLTGERFDADEAFRIGLIQDVVGPEDLHDRALELAHKVADQAPLAVRQTRLAARLAVEQGWDAAIELMLTEDAREGVVSFLERRKAEFKGN